MNRQRVFVGDNTRVPYGVPRHFEMVDPIEVSKSGLQTERAYRGDAA